MRRTALTAAAVMALATLTALGGNASAERDAEGVASSVGALIATSDGGPAGRSVQVRRSGKDPHVLLLTFDSPTLRRRTTSTVYLPDTYARTAAPLPVLYFLHGVVNFQGMPGQALTDRDFLLQQARAADLQVDLMQFDRNLGRQQFLVVAPDTAPGATWCQTCFWTDGRDGAGVAADTYLHRELIPLVEQLFRVRRDRGGRGVMGHSMGGWGALVQATQHPDRFGFVAALSPLSDYLHDPVFVPFGPSYLRTQGHGEYPVDEAWYREYNPVDAARNLVGSGVKLVIAVGDGCLASPQAPECVNEPKDSTSALEALLRENNDAATSRMTRSGLALTYLRPPGSHGRFNARLYRDVLVDMANRAFARPGLVPVTPSHWTARRSFAVWGYEVRVERAEEAFTGLLAARRDGSAFSLAGVGTATVVTPPGFVPGRAYRVVVTSASAPRVRLVVRADRSGRLRLPGLALGPTTGLDERAAVAETGVTPLARVDVEVLR